MSQRLRTNWQEDSIYALHEGTAPLLVAFPHLGTELPPGEHHRYLERAFAFEDTDWHLDQLYDFVDAMGASTLKPRYSRYLIDLNRPPDDTPMYPGASNTELCPTRFFTGDPLYRDGAAPDAAARADRRLHYWQPYHGALQAELERIRKLHGFVLLWDAHSIRSEIPWLFEGRLPDLNIGSADGKAADPVITAAVVAACSGVEGVTHVLNGRFKGGYTTRHYGHPQRGQHAVQLEKCQCIYMMEEPPYGWLADRAARIQPVLKAMVSAALDATRSRHDQANS